MSLLKIDPEKVRELLCDKCLAMFDRMIAEGRPNDIGFCKKCKAKLQRLIDKTSEEIEEGNP